MQARRGTSISQRAALLGAQLMGAAYRNPETVKSALGAGAAGLAAMGLGSLKPSRVKQLRSEAKQEVNLLRNELGIISKVTRAPVIKGYSTLSQRPTIKQTGGNYRVTHRELINGSVAGSTSFSSQVVVTINPGLLASFPWVSSIANQYEQWKGSVKFLYIPIAPTSTQGDIIMFCDYNVYDPAPTTETQAIDHIGCVTAPVWTSSVMAANTAAMFPTGSKKYIRVANVVGDKRLYDGGKFYLCTNNCANTNVIGKLMVEYSFEFSVPQLEPVASLPTMATSYLAGSSTQTFSTGVAATFNPSPSGWALQYDGLSLGASSSGAISLPPGSYLCTFAAAFSDSSGETFQIQANYALAGVSQGLTAVNVVVNPAGGGRTIVLQQLLSVAVVGGTNLTVQVELTGAGGTLTYAANTGTLNIQQV
jgi:hypothetical protein